MKILLTGGTGYIASHTAIALIEAGYELVLLDNFSNSHPNVLSKLEKITGKNIDFVQGDILDTALVTQILDIKSFSFLINLLITSIVPPFL